MADWLTEQNRQEQRRYEKIKAEYDRYNGESREAAKQVAREEVLRQISPWLAAHQNCDIIVSPNSDCINEIQRLHKRVFTGTFGFDTKTFSAKQRYEVTNIQLKSEKVRGSITGYSIGKEYNSDVYHVSPEYSKDEIIYSVEYEHDEESVSASIHCKAVRAGSASDVLKKESEFSRISGPYAEAKKFDGSRYGKQITEMNRKCKRGSRATNVLALCAILLSLSVMFLGWYVFPVTMKTSLEALWLRLFMPEAGDTGLFRALLIADLAALFVLTIVIRRISYKGDRYNAVLITVFFAAILVSVLVSWANESADSESGRLFDSILAPVCVILVNLKGVIFIVSGGFFIAGIVRLVRNPFYRRLLAKNEQINAFFQSGNYARCVALEREIPAYTVK